MKPKFKNEYSIGTRIKERREALNLSRNAVCEQLDGIALSTLQLWEKNEREPQAGMIIKLAGILKTTINYLLTGNDEQPVIIDREHECRDCDGKDLPPLVSSYAYINVSAGFGSFNVGVTEPDGREPYSEGLLLKLGVKASHCAVFWASGTSMQPTIADGDQLLVDLTRKDIKGDDKIYLVQNGDSIWVKRVRLEWDGLKLISDNKDEYGTIHISKDDAANLQIIGQVIHIGHTLP